jgi:hypothetical protein
MVVKLIINVLFKISSYRGMLPLPRSDKEPSESCLLQYISTTQDSRFIISIKTIVETKVQIICQFNINRSRQDGLQN